MWERLGSGGYFLLVSDANRPPHLRSSLEKLPSELPLNSLCRSCTHLLLGGGRHPAHPQVKALGSQAVIVSCLKMSVHKGTSIFHCFICSVLTHIFPFPLLFTTPRKPGDALFGKVLATGTVLSVQRLHLNS